MEAIASLAVFPAVFLAVQILSAEQIRAWDQYTIQHEPISSIDLMERAAARCVAWIKTRGWQQKRILIFCGKGNNGGDGLAIGRMLLASGYTVTFFILESGKIGSDDFQTNLQRLHKIPGADLHYLQTTDSFPAIDKSDIVVEALFGTGLNKPLAGLAGELVQHLNAAAATVVSIDLPAGLFADQDSAGNPVVCADHTLTFQCYKTALLVQENAPFIGAVEVLDIQLHPGFLAQTATVFQLVDAVTIKRLWQPRNRFAHKGSFGHALLAGGSYGKMGAMVLATKACLRTGAGLTTVLIPRCGYTILQTTAPEAMAVMDSGEEILSSLPDETDRYSAIGIGPGMGTRPETQNFLSFIVRRYHKPLVLDADALNCLAQARELQAQLPPGSVLTPHPKEFDLLFGDHASSFHRIKTAQEKAKELGLVIVLKGHHSLIATPTGMGWFNSTGNAGMAKGGSGDVLTGIITALLAQGYGPADAAILGVYLHGSAGNAAARRFSQEAMLPSDLVDCLPEVFLNLAHRNSNA